VAQYYCFLVWWWTPRIFYIKDSVNRLNVDKYYPLTLIPLQCFAEQLFDILSEDFSNVRKNQCRVQFRLCLNTWASILLYAVTRVKHCGCVSGVLLCDAPCFKDLVTRLFFPTTVHMYCTWGLVLLCHASGT
jgi:hypothetical protein